MWLDKLDPTASGPQGGRFEGYMLTITKPDGSIETQGPFRADPASFAYSVYRPTDIGTYTLKFDFPGQQVKGTGALIPVPIDEYYEPSSVTTTLKVAEQQINPLPQVAPSEDYWTRPIDAQNQEWYTISGNWLGIGPTTFGNTLYDISGNFQPYSKAPNTAHIVWTKPLTFGGLIGGEFGGTSVSNYYTGKSYEPKFTPPVIISGVLYYNDPLPPKNGFYAVDLRTGETLWRHESYGPVTEVGAAGLAGLGTPGYAGISCGQVFNYLSPNEEGARAYLWFSGSAPPAGLPGMSPWYYLYNAETGDLILEMQNVTAGGSRVMGPNGELLYYFLTPSSLTLWNSTKAIGTGAQFSTGLWTWRPKTGGAIDWRNGIQWNVTLQPVPGQAIASIGEGKILATTGNQFVPFDWQMEIAYDMQTGQRLWIQNRTTPKGSTAFGMMGRISEGVYTQYDKGAMQWRGFSIETGDQIWGPTEPLTNPWDSQPYAPTSAYGNMYTRTMAGIHALNLQTGERLWDFYADPSGTNFPGMASYPFLAGETTVADKKIFAPTGNSHGDPLFRGAQLYAIDADSGNKVWSINGFFMGTLPVADGYLVGQNGYDNQIYCFGKGQTATTVNVQNNAISQGDTLLITGSITDQSPGANGTAAIADEDMTAWMEYLYQDQPKPDSASGVRVHLSAIDPNNNLQDIGSTTSDDMGNYAISWKPPVPGLYRIKATFEGSESYFSSEAGTSFVVLEPSAGPQTTSNVNTISPETFYGFAIAVIVLIVVVGILVIKKK
jgi:hypothetical protein